MPYMWRHRDVLGFDTCDYTRIPLQWRHNEHHGVWNHRQPDCWFNHLFRVSSMKISKSVLRVFFEGNPPVTGGFSPHKAPLTRYACPCDDVIMLSVNSLTNKLHRVWMVNITKIKQSKTNRGHISWIILHVVSLSDSFYRTPSNISQKWRCILCLVSFHFAMCFCNLVSYIALLQKRPKN